MLSHNCSLAEFQEANGRIYNVVNDRYYSIQEMFSWIHRHTTYVVKAARKKKYRDTDYHLCMAMSWSFALANRLHIDLAEEMWKSFPGLCPYCLSTPCACRRRAKERKKMAGRSRGRKPYSLSQWQRMFARIYPNVVQNSAMHLSEEVGEVGEAIRNHLATHAEKWFRRIVEELVDTITNIFSVASCLGLDLAGELADYFAEGCPKCHQAPCDCGYVDVDEPIFHHRKNRR